MILLHLVLIIIFLWNGEFRIIHILLMMKKTCILDAVDNAVRDLFLGNVKELLHDRPLDYIIVNHMEPDHSGSLLELAKRYPEAKICATPAALKMFEQYFHEPMAERYIRTNENW